MQAGWESGFGQQMPAGTRSDSQSKQQFGQFGAPGQAELGNGDLAGNRGSKPTWVQGSCHGSSCCSGTCEASTRSSDGPAQLGNNSFGSWLLPRAGDSGLSGDASRNALEKLPGLVDGGEAVVQKLSEITGCSWGMCAQALQSSGNNPDRAMELLVQHKSSNGNGSKPSIPVSSPANGGMLPSSLPLPGALSGNLLPSAVLPGVTTPTVSGSSGSFGASRSEVEQQEREEQELLGALAFSLSEQQAEQGRAPRAASAGRGNASGEGHASLDEARAALKSQQMEAERAVAAATQQAQQLEAERAAAIAAAAEAMRQRREAETPPQPIICEFCGRWLSEMALDQGNHMCDEFWSYNAEFQSTGAQCALLIGGVQHLKPEHLQSLAMRFPNMRRVKHGNTLAEFNGLFMLSDEQRQTQALRLLANCNVRTIPLGHAASWRCLHVQLSPASSPQRVGQAESSLQSQLQRTMQQNNRNSGAGSDALAPDGNAPGRSRAAADAWALRASDAKRRGEPGQQVGGPGQFFANPPMPTSGSGPGSTPGDWKCSNCGNINFAFREKCNRCNTPRPGAKMFGSMQQNERRVCPFTVMLMRVPSHATESQVAEALMTFGELASAGIKFHRQGAKFKQRRGRMPPDGLALHAFCRFLRPASASSALQRGEVMILGQPVQINPAFMRGAIPADIDSMDGNGMPTNGPPASSNNNQFPGMGSGMMGSGSGGIAGMAGTSQGGGMRPNSGAYPPGFPPMPPFPQSGMPGALPGGPGNGSGGAGGNASSGLLPLPSASGVMGGGGANNLADLGEHMAAMTTNSGSATPSPPPGSNAVQHADVAAFLGAALPLLWQADTFRMQVLRAAPSPDALLAGLQKLLGVTADGRASLSSPPALQSALPSLFTDAARAKLSPSNDAGETFESMLSLLSESSDPRLAQLVERSFSMSCMEMCECACDEVLEPLHYKQCAAYVSVPLLLESPSDGTALASRLASSAGPVCPTANCGNRMRILRYLMAPMPAMLCIGLSWDTQDVQPNTIHSLMIRVDQAIDLRRAFKSTPAPASASLRGILCSSNGNSFHTIGLEPGSRTWIHFRGGGIDAPTAVGDEWDQVVNKCAVMRLKPAMLLYQIDSSQHA